MFCKNCGHKNKIGGKYCKNCGMKLEISKRMLFFAWIEYHRKGVIIFVILIILALLVLSNNSSRSPSSQIKTANNITVSPTIADKDSYEVSSSVVNIICDNDSGGSGTIWVEYGLIMTNNHVIADSNYCLVTIPDPTTGVAINIYHARPIIVPQISEQYDIAMLKIDSSFTDKKGKTWGIFPTTFQTFDFTNNCKNKTPKLGDSIRIYGYPVTSGGYNLTITDGIISSFEDDGNILTSAKIDSGNSGGLAIDQDGCMVGIPSAVLTGRYQNLGVIIPAYTITDFLDKATAQKDTNTTQQQPTTQPKSPSNQIIDCVGPDNKHLNVSQKECDDFNEAWRPTPSNGWSLNQEELYLSSCTTNNGRTRSMCLCTLRYFESNYTPDQYKGYFDQYQGQSNLPLWKDAINNCSQ